MTKCLLVLGFWFMALALACQSGDDDDSTVTADDDAGDDDAGDDTGGGDDDECHICEASFYCQQDLGDEYECVDLSQDDRPHPEYGETGCCVASPFTADRCERGMNWFINECGVNFAGGDDAECLTRVCESGNAALMCLAYCFDLHAPDCEAAESCWADNDCTTTTEITYEC